MKDIVKKSRLNGVTVRLNAVAFWVAVAGCCVLLILFCTGCAPERPACAPEALAEIKSAYVAEAAAVCKLEGANYDDCQALPAIRAKYKAKREEWQACQ